MLSRFRFEEQVLAAAFGLAFMAVFALIFIKTDRTRFVLSGAILTALAYPIAGYACVKYYQLLSRPSAADFSPAGMGFIMFLAAGFAMNVVLRRWRHDVFGPVPVRPRRYSFTFFLVGYSILFGILAIVFIYPVVLLMVEIFPSSQLRLTRLFEPTQASFSSAWLQLTALASSIAVSATFVAALVKKRRVEFFLMLSVGSFVLYNIGIPSYIRLQDAIASSLSRKLSATTCASADPSACLLFAEHGWIFGLAFALATVIVERTFRRISASYLYRF